MVLIVYATISVLKFAIKLLWMDVMALSRAGVALARAGVCYPCRVCYPVPACAISRAGLG
jgi:hypothetical protein